MFPFPVSRPLPLIRYAHPRPIPALNVFRYITFRTAMAAVTALLLALALGPPMIRLLKRRQIGQSIREAGPKSHLSKAGTPTMGGLLILLAVIVATLLWMDLSNRFVWIALGTLVALGAVGFADDFVKFTPAQPRPDRPRQAAPPDPRGSRDRVGDPPVGGSRERFDRRHVSRS